MIKLALPIVAALAISGCAQVRDTIVSDLAVAAPTVTAKLACAGIVQADKYFQQHVSTGKIGQLTAYAERIAMSRVSGYCADPVRFGKIIIGLYKFVQDVTKTGLP